MGRSLRGPGFDFSGDIFGLQPEKEDTRQNDANEDIAKNAELHRMMEEHRAEIEARSHTDPRIQYKRIGRHQLRYKFIYGS
ncbi:hypothetical protein KC678_03265 [Candidatus Dojkabacteria bacterium]|uniref:Uncharacterized protein n=1 Tax=Candidatus Dojkabacteria bacterium TaxID=2099670 RepID=A0A955L1P9_9BACT|nr:hypothetical protein [Candidatus Dojkabacteria bacterium]